MKIKEQSELIRKCVQKKFDFNQELRKQGYSYDDLVYRHNSLPLFHEDYAEYLSIDTLKRKKNSIPVVSFFSGSGGLDLGFEAGGYNHLAAVEIEKMFCETLRLNRPNWKVIGPPHYSGDARKRDEISLALRETGIKAPFNGIFIGGPPCQPFSVAANQRFKKNGNNFKRIGFQNKEHGNLLFDYIWYIKTFNPSVFLIENVPGFLSVDNGKQVELALCELTKSGYQLVGPKILDASNYGVPQKRNRVFIVGWRTDKDFVFPEPLNKRVPVLNALAGDFTKLPNHLTRKHFAESIERYAELNFGERDHLGRIDRLDAYSPAKTVIAGGTKGGGRSHLHPFIPRTLSVRECARLQTFPDQYVFTGSPARQYTQVGNAVPPLLAFYIAKSIYKQLFS